MLLWKVDLEAEDSISFSYIRFRRLRFTVYVTAHQAFLTRSDTQVNKLLMEITATIN